MKPRICKRCQTVIKSLPSKVVVIKEGYVGEELIQFDCQCGTTHAISVEDALWFDESKYHAFGAQLRTLNEDRSKVA